MKRDRSALTMVFLLLGVGSASTVAGGAVKLLPGQEFLYAGVMGFPTNVLIDREGKVRYAEPGFDPAALNTALQGLLGNSP